jgi:hypothetical protein
MIWAIGTTNVNDEESIGEIWRTRELNSSLNSAQIIQLVTTALLAEGV